MVHETKSQFIFILPLEVVFFLSANLQQFYDLGNSVSGLWRGLSSTYIFLLWAYVSHCYRVWQWQQLQFTVLSQHGLTNTSCSLELSYDFFLFLSSQVLSQLQINLPSDHQKAQIVALPIKGLHLRVLLQQVSAIVLLDFQDSFLSATWNWRICVKQTKVVLSSQYHS